MAVYSFDNLDDMFEQMERDQQAADAAVQDWQAAIKPGDYVCRNGPGFMIYSEILPDPEPREETQKHFRFTRSYSMACPNGELGDIHVSMIERVLSRDEFDDAWRNHWS